MRGVEREEAMRYLQESLNDEQRKLSNVRDALDKEMQLNKQLEEKLSFEKLLKSEVEHELAKSRADLAEVIKANEALQQELSRGKSPMYETANKLRDREDVSQNTLRENCVQRERFHLYLYGVPFVLQTDHGPLKYMNSGKIANGRLMRWAMFLQSYNFRVEAIKGSENVGADYLSRVQE